ncbi:MAG: hypothetical protein IPJ98_31095 [Bryobacterales bacterium]|nr:hypothetical protein [Bryobacterales bacterium]
MRMNRIVLIAASALLAGGSRVNSPPKPTSGAKCGNSPSENWAGMSQQLRGSFEAKDRAPPP